MLNYVPDGTWYNSNFSHGGISPFPLPAMYVQARSIVLGIKYLLFSGA